MKREGKSRAHDPGARRNPDPGEVSAVPCDCGLTHFFRKRNPSRSICACESSWTAKLFDRDTNPGARASKEIKSPCRSQSTQTSHPWTLRTICSRAPNFKHRQSTRSLPAFVSLTDRKSVV